MKKTKNNNVIVNDWAGNTLFEGDYLKEEKELDKVLKVNQDEDGLYPDIYVIWQDSSRDNENVYELINY